MNKHDIELPPLPSPLGIVDPEGTEGMAQYTVSDLSNYAKAYAMDAIAPYKQRIAEMEAELEAIGAGGVDGRRITPSNTSAKITERSQAYLDSNLGADEHAAFIKWAREAHDYPDYARLILDSEWCQGAVAGWQGAIEADRQRGGEPVGEIRPDDQSDDEVWAEIWADLPPGTKLYAEPVQKAQKECSKDAERSEPVKVPSASEIDDDFQNWLYLGQTYYEPDDLNKQSKEVAQAAWKDAASRYSHPVEPDGWQLVPKEPTREMAVGVLQKQTIEYADTGKVPTHSDIYRAMLEAAPKFGEEECTG